LLSVRTRRQVEHLTGTALKQANDPHFVNGICHCAKDPVHN
jgi:hypothetical protein